MRARIIGDTIVYVDGAYKNPDGPNPKYVASNECWMGKLPDAKKADITKIRWTQASAASRQRALSHRRRRRTMEKKSGRIYFSGGTDNPYNYNGIGYNGQPAEPSPVTFAFNAYSREWETINENTPEPTMDHRGLLVTRRGLVIVGGMEKGQQVTPKVTVVKPLAGSSLIRAKGAFRDPSRPAQGGLRT